MPLRYEILCLALIILPFENMLGPVRKGRDVYTCSGNPERITRTKNIIMPLARNDVAIVPRKKYEAQPTMLYNLVFLGKK